MNDDEESVIHDRISEADHPQGFQIVSSEEASEQEDGLPHSSGTFVRCSYGSLKDENNLINDQKFISSISQLKALVGKNVKWRIVTGILLLSLIKYVGSASSWSRLLVKIIEAYGIPAHFMLQDWH